MSFKDFMSVQYGYEEIYGFSGGGVNQVAREVKNYNLNAILESCSKIALKATTKPLGFHDPNLQVELVRDIFAQDLDIRTRIVNRVRRGGVQNWVVFSEPPLLLLIKVALEKAMTKGGKSITPEEVGRLGHWLLKLADEYLTVPKVEVPESYLREYIREFMARGYLILSNERLAYKVGRFYRLVTLISKNPKRFPLESGFKNATGYSISDFYSFSFYLFVNRVNNVTKTIDIAKEWIVCKKKYFAKTRLKQDKVEGLLELFLLRHRRYLADYKRTVTKILKGRDIYTHNLLLLQKKPLIPLNKECFVCPSVKLLTEKATEGVYWILEDYFKEKDKKLWNELPSVFGEALEIYVHEILKRAFGKSNYFRNPKVNGQEIVDGIIIGKNNLFFTEIKFAHWSYEATITGKRSAMEPTLHQLFGNPDKAKGLGQISRAIDLFKNKKLDRLLRNENFKKTIPLLISGEKVPMDEYNRKMYEDVAKETKSLPNADLPFIVLHIEELEILEGIASVEGSEFVEELLMQYATTFVAKTALGYTKGTHSFKNFLSSIGYKASNNERLLRYFDKVANTAARKAFGSKIKSIERRRTR